MLQNSNLMIKQEIKPSILIYTGLGSDFGEKSPNFIFLVVNDSVR